MDLQDLEEELDFDRKKGFDLDLEKGSDLDLDKEMKVDKPGAWRAAACQDPPSHPRPKLWKIVYAKDCLLTGQEQACSRITWLVVCLFVCLFVTILQIA